MPQKEKDNECEAQKEVEDARIGYQAAVNLWAYEGSTIWSKFTAMLVANSIVVGSIAVSMTAEDPSSAFVVGMPIGGIILCLLWIVLSERSLCMYDYWIFSGREIEERFLSSSVDIIRRGGDFTRGEEVTLQIGGQPTKRQMSWLGRRIKVRNAAYGVIALFIATYIALLVLGFREILSC